MFSYKTTGCPPPKPHVNLIWSAPSTHTNIPHTWNAQRRVFACCCSSIPPVNSPNPNLQSPSIVHSVSSHHSPVLVRGLSTLAKSAKSRGCPKVDAFCAETLDRRVLCPSTCARPSFAFWTPWGCAIFEHLQWNERRNFTHSDRLPNWAFRNDF